MADHTINWDVQRVVPVNLKQVNHFVAMGQNVEFTIPVFFSLDAYLCTNIPPKNGMVVLGVFTGDVPEKRVVFDVSKPVKEDEFKKLTANDGEVLIFEQQRGDKFVRKFSRGNTIIHSIYFDGRVFNLIYKQFIAHKDASPAMINYEPVNEDCEELVSSVIDSLQVVEPVKMSKEDMTTLYKASKKFESILDDESSPEDYFFAMSTGITKTVLKKLLASVQDISNAVIDIYNLEDDLKTIHDIVMKYVQQ